jgi:hypothetical protein
MSSGQYIFTGQDVYGYFDFDVILKYVGTSNTFAKIE